MREEGKHSCRKGGAVGRKHRVMTFLPQSMIFVGILMGNNSIKLWQDIAILGSSREAFAILTANNGDFVLAFPTFRQQGTIVANSSKKKRRF
jgi:hypothetical protein